jgi:glycosyltransferase involved in cell wall biosynthesis
VTVISNGVSEEDFPVVDIAEFKRRHALPDASIILFMGRLNTIKGPDLLLRAFLRVRHSFKKYHLVFAGPDGGMLANLQQTVKGAGASEVVHFLGYVGGADKSAAYHMASLLVVPSRQEAMSIVAIEAGICGLPVLLTDQCGFSVIRSIDARLEVPASEEGLSDGLTKLLSEPELLKKLSPEWSNFVNRKYSWTSLVPAYIRLYQNILAEAES